MADAIEPSREETVTEIEKKAFLSYPFQNEQALCAPGQWHVAWRSEGQAWAQGWEVVVGLWWEFLEIFRSVQGSIMLECGISEIWQSSCATIPVHSTHWSLPATEPLAEQRLKQENWQRNVPLASWADFNGNVGTQLLMRTEQTFISSESWWWFLQTL